MRMATAGAALACVLFLGSPDPDLQPGRQNLTTSPLFAGLRGYFRDGWNERSIAPECVRSNTTELRNPHDAQPAPPSSWLLDTWQAYHYTDLMHF